MKTIRGKVRILLLVISLSALALMCFVALSSIGSIRKDVTQASSELGSTAGTSSGRALESQIAERLSSIAAAKASVADEKLGKQQTYTKIIADYASDLYADPLGYKPRQVLPPDPSTAGTNTAQLILAENISRESVDWEIGLLSNLCQTLLVIPDNDPDITADYIVTESGVVIMIDPDADVKPAYVDGRTRVWYKDAKAADSLIWTDIFSDAMGRGLAITCAAPVHDATGQLRGVVGIGALLKNLNKDIISSTIGQTGYVFVVNQEGNIIISPKVETTPDGGFKEVNILQDDNSEIVQMVQGMLDGKSSVAQVEYEGRQVYMACEPMKVMQWGVVAVVDADEALLPVANVSASIKEITDVTISSIDNSVSGAMIAIAIVLVVMLLLVLFFSSFFTKRLTVPLARLTEGVEEISSGVLDTKLNIQTGDELELLSEAFNNMTDRLRQYIDDLTQVTAEKERIGTELEVARRIQASMLPCIFPALEHPEFDIFASIQPAQEMSGDFYDFFLVDEKHLGVVIANASGKGVPAALFMVITKTLIRNHLQNGDSPAQTLTSVNARLWENNDAAMFVTCWLGVLNIETGVLIFGNAGHNPPLLKRGGDEFEYLKSEPGFVLAGLPTISYGQSELALSVGDTLFLYTDGITECVSAQGEVFGNDRLKNALNSAETACIKELLAGVRTVIESYTEGTEQHDDRGMLGLTFRGNGK